MKFPNTIPISVKNVYETSTEAKLNICHDKGNISADIFESEYNGVHNLKVICLHTISKYFDIISPIPRLLENDFKYLVNILSTNLHPKYTLEISDDIYWERCYKEKYQEIFHDNREGFWKKIFLSKYLQSLIEETDLNNIEEIVNISKLIGPFIDSLTLTTLKVIEKIELFKHVRFADDDDDECLSCKIFKSKFDDTLMVHTALDDVLQNLINLNELRLEFSLNNLADHRNDMLFRLSILDCELISRGLSSIENFKILKVNCCYIDDVNAKIFSKYIMHNNHMEEIDFSYCGMSDEAVRSLSDVIYHENIKRIILLENDFSDDGIKTLFHAISKKSKGCIDVLNLSMNLISDIGASYIASGIVRSKNNLKQLILRGCGIKNEGSFKISGALKYNRGLHSLDLAGNDFSNAENVLLESLNSNPTIKMIEMRFSGLSDNAIEKIEAILKRNKKRKDAIDELCIAPLYIDEPEYFIWDYNPDNPDCIAGFYPERIALS